MKVVYVVSMYIRTVRTWDGVVRGGPHGQSSPLPLSDSWGIPRIVGRYDDMRLARNLDWLMAGSVSL